MSFKKKEAGRDSSADEYTLVLMADEVNTVKSSLENRPRNRGLLEALR